MCKCLDSGTMVVHGLTACVSSGFDGTLLLVIPQPRGGVARGLCGERGWRAWASNEQLVGPLC